MNPPAPDVYCAPLPWKGLSAALAAWEQSLRSNRYWVMGLDNAKASARIRDSVAKGVVWLEMKGMSGPARRLNDACQAMRKTTFACTKAMALYGPTRAKGVPEAQSLRDAWVASVESLRGTTDRVMAEVPPEVWEGIDE